MCNTKKKVIRLSAILLSLVILLTAIPTIPYASAASAADNVGEKLESIITKDGFVPGQASNCSCKVFADAVSKKLFGTTTGSLTSTPYVLNTSDYNCIATLKNASQTELVNLLKKAKPGDVIQYKSGYTNPYHTAVIFSVSSDGLKLLNTRTIGGQYYVMLDSMKWSTITSSWPGIGSISGSGRGLSLYHSKKYNELYEEEITATATLNKKSITLGVGETYTLKGTVDCDSKDCTSKYSTSSSSVASVSSSGKLTAKKSGTATITYSCSDGAKATCKVTVKSAPESVELNKTSITLGVGETFDLNSTVNSGSASLKRTYTTTDSSVATVKNTVITAKKAGTAIIKVKTFNGKTATCKVTVRSAPTKVLLNKTSITLGVGETFDFSSTVNSGTASYLRTYTTNSSSVASVKSAGGLVTAKKAGTATITVKTFNGKTATCKVTVKKAPTSIKLNKTSVTLKVGEKFDFSSTVNSGTASNKRTYTTSNSAVAAMGSNGIITAKKAGTATITVKTFNGKTATCKVTVKK